MKALIALGFSLTVLGSTAASAAQITQTDESTFFSSTPFGFNAMYFVSSFHQFDPLLGVLNSVTVTLSGLNTYKANFSLSDCPSLASCYASYVFSTGVAVNKSGVGGFPTTDLLDFETHYSGTVLGTDLSPLNHTVAGSSGPLALSNLANYIGSGSISLLETVGEDSDFCGPRLGINCTPLIANIDIFTTLTYNYTVPEPITLSLFGAGLAGAVAMRRRRAKG